MFYHGVWPWLKLKGACEEKAKNKKVTSFFLGF
jgi:hypothetical protein